MLLHHLLLSSGQRIMGFCVQYGESLLKQIDVYRLRQKVQCMSAYVRQKVRAVKLVSVIMATLLTPKGVTPINE